MIAGNDVKPRGRARIAAEAIHMAPGLQENFLRQICGPAAATTQAEAPRLNARMKAAVELTPAPCADQTAIPADEIAERMVVHPDVKPDPASAPVPPNGATSPQNKLCFVRWPLPNRRSYL